MINMQAMDKFDIIFFGFIFGGLALYIIAGMIRMAVDPEYERKVKDEAARQRAERKKGKKSSAYHDWQYYAKMNGTMPKDAKY